VARALALRAGNGCWIAVVGGANGDAATAAAHRVPFNYYRAATLTTNSVVGSVLAPDAAVTGDSGQIDGNLGRRGQIIAACRQKAIVCRTFDRIWKM